MLQTTQSSCFPYLAKCYCQYSNPQSTFETQLTLLNISLKPPMKLQFYTITAKQMPAPPPPPSSHQVHQIMK